MAIGEDVKSKNLFEKAALVIQDVQAIPRKTWVEIMARDSQKIFGYSSTIDISKYVSNEHEAKLLCHIVTMILQDTPNAGFLSTLRMDDDFSQCKIKISGSKEIIRSVTDAEPVVFSNEEIQFNFNQFLADNSLAMASQGRQLTPDFLPTNTREALASIRWQESQRLFGGKGDKGYYIGFPGSHGSPDATLFFSPEDKNRKFINQHFIRLENQHSKRPLPPADWVFAHTSEPRFPDSRNIPAILQVDHSTTLVLKEDAKAILVDFIGLDAKILGLNTREVAQ